MDVDDPDSKMWGICLIYLTSRNKYVHVANKANWRLYKSVFTFTRKNPEYYPNCPKYAMMSQKIDFIIGDTPDIMES